VEDPSRLERQLDNIFVEKIKLDINLPRFEKSDPGSAKNTKFEKYGRGDIGRKTTGHQGREETQSKGQDVGKGKEVVYQNAGQKTGRHNNARSYARLVSTRVIPVGQTWRPKNGNKGRGETVLGRETVTPMQYGMAKQEYGGEDEKPRRRIQSE